MWRLPGSSISELHRAFQQGLLHPSEVLQASLETAKHIQSLNAFVHLREGSEQQKKQLEGSLCGIPIAVKDNFCVKGWPTTCASAMLRNYVPPFSATVVEKAEAAGAVVIGKTNMDEFAMGSGGLDSIFGATKSLWRSGIPYRLDKAENAETAPLLLPDGSGGNDWIVAGGSSSGSAVAVSSGACLAALGSDTGGSVRIPGSWNGIVTLKPTYGALSRHGLIPLCNSMDVPGLMARCVHDVAVFFDALKGIDARDSTTVQSDFFPAAELNGDPDVSQLTVGIPLEYHCVDMSEEVLSAWSEVTDLLESAGVRVVPVSLPHTPYSIMCYSVLNPCEVASNMARYDGLQYGLRGDNASSTEAIFADCRHRGFNYVVRGRILAGNYFLLRENARDYFLRSLKVRRLVAQDFNDVWKEGVDLLLTPATLNEAPKFSDFSRLDNRTQATKQDYCTQPANLAGIPAATIPVKLSSNYLPISLQVIGQRHRDGQVLGLCKWLENRLNFPRLVLVD